MHISRTVALAALSATASMAQSPLYQDFGVVSVDKMGYSTRCAGDVNADGYVDGCEFGFGQEFGSWPRSRSYVVNANQRSTCPRQSAALLGPWQ